MASDQYYVVTMPDKDAEVGRIVRVIDGGGDEPSVLKIVRCPGTSHRVTSPLTRDSFQWSFEYYIRGYTLTNGGEYAVPPSVVYFVLCEFFETSKAD